MSHWNDEKFERVLEEVVKRATIDPEFRQLALSNGRQAVQKFDPAPFPEGMNLEFREGQGMTNIGFEISGSNRTVILPDLTWTSSELTDMELADVAGADGCIGTCSCTACCCSSCCVTEIPVITLPF
jgi:hypothetical protein